MAEEPKKVKINGKDIEIVDNATYALIMTLQDVAKQLKKARLGI